MMTLFDMLAKSDNGKAMDMLARQFNLNRQQAELAVEALVPAFSRGLKQNASDPYGVGSFMNAMASGRHASYFDNPMQAFSQQGVNEGNGILGHLFGSKDLSRAVAAQAAQSTGIGQEILKQMLPVIASMIMGGLFKQSTGQMGQASGSGNPLGDMLAEMMRQGQAMNEGMMRQPRPEAPQPGANPFDNPFGKMLEGMFGGGTATAREAPQAPQSPYGENPLGRIFEEMMRGTQPRAEPEAQTPEPRDNPSGRARTPYDDLFGEMFESGAKTRDDYQKNLDSVFDQFLKGMDRNR